jgi:arylformamidase
VLDYRAEFDAEVTLDGGGELRARGFRLNIPHADVTDSEITALLVAALAPQRVQRAEVSDVRIIAEPHPPAIDTEAGRVRFVELSHVITAGMVTYPGLPVPEITPHLTRSASRGHYATGTEFAIDRISMVGNTGTYLDSPYHRYADGTDLAGIPLERLAYGVDAPYLTRDGAQLLADRGAALVGIDAVNIDDASPAAAGERPAHSLLLAAGIPIVEHLTNLRELPPVGGYFTAVPPRVARFGSFPVRAFATVPADEPSA